MTCKYKTESTDNFAEFLWHLYDAAGCGEYIGQETARLEFMVDDTAVVAYLYWNGRDDNHKPRDLKFSIKEATS